MCTRKDYNKPPPTACCRASLSKHFFSKSTSNQSTVYTDFTSRCLHAKTIIHQRQPHLDLKLYCQVLRLEHECLRKQVNLRKVFVYADTYSFLTLVSRDETLVSREGGNLLLSGTLHEEEGWWEVTDQCV